MNYPRVVMTSALAVAMCMLFAASVSAKHGKKADPPQPVKPASSDASRDPAKDLQQAIAVATKTNRKILLEVGGDWCVYCHIMDQTFDKHPDSSGRETRIM